MNLAPIPANLYTELRIKYVRKESAATIVFCRTRKRFSYPSVENALYVAGHVWRNPQSERRSYVMRALITYRRPLIEDGANK